MFLKKKKNRRFEPVIAPHAHGVRINWAIAKEDGAPNFALRIIRVKRGGLIDFHEHDYEHEIYCIRGRGTAFTKRKRLGFGAGDVLYVEPGISHGFKNVSNSVLEFVCVIPIK